MAGNASDPSIYLFIFLYICLISGRKLYTHGEGGEFYVWDMNSRTCESKLVDDGCISGRGYTKPEHTLKLLIKFEGENCAISSFRREIIIAIAIVEEK